MEEPSKFMPPREGDLQLLDRYGQALETAEDVGEPQANELDVVLARLAEDVLDLLWVSF